MKEYKFNKKEKEFIESLRFKFKVDKNMSDDQTVYVIETIEKWIQENGIENDEETPEGSIAVDVLTKMANEDN